MSNVFLSQVVNGGYYTGGTENDYYADGRNNMGRTGRHWTAPVSDTPTYTNNRRSDWTFDASGNVTSRDEGQRTHAYDAAGQQRNFYEEGLQTSGRILHLLRIADAT